MLEKIGRNIGKIFLGIIAIALFLFGYQCGNSKNSFKTDSKTSTDTLIVHTTDTIKPLPEIKWYALKPQIRVDTILKPIYLDSTECNRVYIYEDSTITKDYNIYSKLHIQGKLRFDTIGVKLKVPLVIYDSTKMVITKYIESVKPNKWDIKVGILASPKMLAPTIDLTIKRTSYTIGYDPFNKQPIIGLKYTLFRSKK